MHLIDAFQYRANHIYQPGTGVHFASCQSSPWHPGDRTGHSAAPEKNMYELETSNSRFHLHAEIYDSHVCIVEFVQLIGFSKVKLFKPWKD